MSRSRILRSPKTPLAYTGRGPLVLNDEPTLSDSLEMPTLPNLRRVRPTAAPTWPIRAESHGRPAARGRRRLGWPHLAALGASAVLLLSVFALLSVLNLPSYAGLFSQSGPAAHAQPTSAAATRDAAPTPTAVSGWLQVAPTSMQFGCADHQRTQTVVLVNHGPRQAHWQASFVTSAGQPGVAVSPGNGDLGAGESTPVQLQVTTSSTGQEVIRFSSTDPAAGAAGSLGVTTVGCS